MARRRNQIPSTSETNLYFANIMLIAFCVQPPAIFLHSGGKFPSCCDALLALIKGGTINRINTEMMHVRWRMFQLYRQILKEQQKEMAVCSSRFAKFIIMINVTLESN